MRTLAYALAAAVLVGCSADPTALAPRRGSGASSTNGDDPTTGSASSGSSSGSPTTGSSSGSTATPGDSSGLPCDVDARYAHRARLEVRHAGDPGGEQCVYPKITSGLFSWITPSTFATCQ